MCVRDLAYGMQGSTLFLGMSLTEWTYWTEWRRYQRVEPQPDSIRATPCTYYQDRAV